MKIDRSRLKKGTSEVPPECQILIDKLKKCNRRELAEELSKIDSWTFGKCELYHWIDVLDIFDSILEEAAEFENDSEWILAIDQRFSLEDTNLVLLVLHFTTLLIEHSFSRHLYNSVQYLVTLLQTNDLDVVLAVLELLYMFSKRSNFITRVNTFKKISLISRVSFLAETWGGKEQGFGLAECCSDKAFNKSPYHTQYFEILNDKQAVERIQLSELSVSGRDPREVAEYVCSRLEPQVGSNQKIHVFTRMRTAIYFFNYTMRLKFVQARLQALSILVYSNFTPLINVGQYLYPGFMEELVDLLQLENPEVVEIQAAALRTLTSITHLERNSHYPKKNGSRLYTIIDVTGASSYHGFLPGLVRSCISNLISPQPTATSPLFPMSLATSLFSFLYHLASYEPGGEALVSSGMMDSLLKVINWPGTELEHITFVTRAVRVIDLITNMDMQSFQNYGGLQSFIKRLSMEVDICRKEQPFEIQTRSSGSGTAVQEGDEEILADDYPPVSPTREDHLRELKEQIIKTSVEPKQSTSAGYIPTKTCLPQRAALLKSMLNFLKKAIQDAAFSESIRHVMEGGLPNSLRHIISNSEYYGPSLFLLATDVVTVYVFQEPTLLSYLQDIGLTEVVLQALLKKEVPATREVLGSLPNVFSALCLNTRGLNSFIRYNPFDKFFRVLISPTYLPAMRRRRNSDPLGDTASNLGNAMDELMRHQPSLRQKAIASVIKLLDELVYLGTDPAFVCWNPQNKSETSSLPRFTPSSATLLAQRNSGNNDGGGSSDDDEDDDEEEEEEPTVSQPSTAPTPRPSITGVTYPGNVYQQYVNLAASSSFGWTNRRIPVPLLEYITNVMKFVDSILSNNSTDDHCIEFVNAGGLKPLILILALPNLPIDPSVATTAQSVAAVCKSILNLSHDPRVLKKALCHLADVVDILKPLNGHLDNPGGSILLRELSNCPNMEGAFTISLYTPLLHAMSAVHAYVVMLVHICRTGQQEIRQLTLECWGAESKSGKKLLQNLVQLYTSLVWESTLLLALSTDDILQPGVEFDVNGEDIEKLVPSDFKSVSEVTWDKIILNNRCVGVAKIVENLETGNMEFETPPVTTEYHRQTDNKVNTETGNISPASSKKQVLSPTPAQLKFIRDLLNASSRLGRALAELFGLLVKLCVGLPFRQRRQNNIVPPHANAREIARVLSHILVDGLSINKLPPSPIPKLKLTFLICAISFTSPMLYDDKKYPFHLMLENFVDEGGLDAFFNMFKYALTSDGKYPLSDAIEHPELPEGTGEFLDSWLVLLEKLTNPKAIADSPHIISPSQPQNKNQTRQSVVNNVTEFDITGYLKSVHNLAFCALRYLWGTKPLKLYGTKVTEMILTIYRHIIIGEGIRKACDEEISQELLAENVKQLMDMGFPRKLCEEALERAAGVVEQATEFLLSNHQNHDNDYIYDQLMMYEFHPRTDKKDKDKQKSSKSAGEPHCSKENIKRIDEDNYEMNEDTMNKFTDNAIQVCINLLDELPETVYRVCDLLVSVMQRNGKKFRDLTLNNLCIEIKKTLSELLVTINNINNIEEICHGDLAKQASVRIHLYTLLFEGHCSEELRVPCANAIYRNDVIPDMMNILLKIEEYMTKQRESDDNSKSCNSLTPKWMAPLFLLLDLYEKVSMLTLNRTKMHEVTTKTWKWYDLSAARWNDYSVTNNRIINDAYWSGKSMVRITCGRQRYTISFGGMTQVNDETGNQRPVNMWLKCLEDSEDIETEFNVSPFSASTAQVSQNVIPFFSSSSSPGLLPIQTTDDNCNSSTTLLANPLIDHKKTESSSFKMDEDEPPTDEICAFNDDEMYIIIPSISTYDRYELVVSCVKIMKLPIDRDTLHAVMRVCVRLTRNYENAKRFALNGGVKLLLSLGQESSYLGYQTLATILIRHTLEEPKTLVQAMGKVIATRTLPSLPPAYREAMYLTRQIFPAVARDPHVWATAAKNVLRIDISSLRPSTLNPIERLILKMSPNEQTNPQKSVDRVTEEVVEDLLLALTESEFKYANQNKNKKEPSSNNYPAEMKINSVESPSSSSSSPKSQQQHSNESTIAQNEEYPQELGNKKLPILPRILVMKTLAAAICSYNSVASAVVDFQYTPKNCPILTEKVSALTFILDYILSDFTIVEYFAETSKEGDCTAGAKILIAALSSSTDCRILNSLATEVKNALNRVLSMTETRTKHTRIQLLCEVIETMIESSHSANFLVKIPQNQQLIRSPLCYIMYRKHFLTDLARASQSIDLTSVDVLKTMNAILEPLETLMRISNLPTSTVTDVKSQKKTEAETRSRSSSPLLQLRRSRAQSNRSTEQRPVDGQIEVNLEEIMDHFIEQSVQSNNDNQEVSPTEQSEQAQIETSSESGDDSESNQSDNDDADMNDDDEDNDDEEENEDDEDDDDEQRSEMDVDEETRQFIEFYDHPMQTSSSNTGGGNSTSENIPTVDPTSRRSSPPSHRHRRIPTLIRGTTLFTSSSRNISPNVVDIEHRGSGSHGDEIFIMQFSASGAHGSNTTANPVRGVIGSQHATNTSDDNAQRFLFPPIEDTTVQNASGTQNVNGSSHHHSNIAQSAASTITNHPLLANRSSANSPFHQLNLELANSRMQSRWSTRQRRYQFLNFNARNNATPVILQRLLGPGTQNQRNNSTVAGNAAGNNGNQTATAFRDATRVVVMDNSGLSGLFSSSARNDEENIDVIDHAGLLFGRTIPQTINQTSTTLYWWNEEAKVLGYDLHSDVCSTACAEIIPFIESTRPLEEQELANRPTATNFMGSGSQHESRESTLLPMVVLPASSVRSMLARTNEQHLSRSAVSITLGRENNSSGTSDRDDHSSANRNLDSGVSITLNSRQVRQNDLLRILNLHNLDDESEDIDETTTEANEISNNETSNAMTGQFDNSEMDDSTNNQEDTPNDDNMQQNSNSSSMQTTREQTSEGPESEDIPTIYVLNSEEGTEMVAREQLQRDGDSSSEEYTLRITDSEDDESDEDDEENDNGCIVRDLEQLAQQNVESENQQPQQSADTTEALREQSSGGIEISRLNMTDDSEVEFDCDTFRRTEDTERNTTYDEDAVLFTGIPEIDEENGQRVPQRRNSIFVLSSPISFSGRVAQDSGITREQDELNRIQSVVVPTNENEAIHDIVPAILHQSEITELNSDNVRNVQQRLRDLNSVFDENTPVLYSDMVTQDSSISREQENLNIAQSLDVQTTENQTIDDSIRTILGDIEIPDGVDPSFLAALPDELRAEVLAEHNRLQRMGSRLQSEVQQASTSSGIQPAAETALVEVNPEFLAALPPNIQEEVLAQQRMELQRQAAATANPEDPVDWAAFFQNLTPALRQAILTDMEESQLSVLPADLAAEAQTLRREWEGRNPQVMQRIMNQIGNSPDFSTVFRYRSNNFRGHNATRPNWSSWNNLFNNQIEVTRPAFVPPSNIERATPLLDHESITSILVLIFISDSRVTKYYHSRLQRIIRHLCVHAPTRAWIIQSLISIMEKCNTTTDLLKHDNFNENRSKNRSEPRPTWLAMKVDPSISSTAHIFSFYENYAPEKRIMDNETIPLHIHPQSITPISCEILDNLIAIAKTYPTSFLPMKTIKTQATSSDDSKTEPPNTTPIAQPVPSTSTGITSQYSGGIVADGQNFWDIILQLDNNAYDRLQQGNNPFGPYSTTPRRPKQFEEPNQYKSFNETPFGKLIPMLKVCKNSYITDKLLRLLSLISMGLTNSTDDEDKNTSGNIPNNYTVDQSLLPQTNEQLRVIVETWTNGTGSEDGLEDATKLIINLSKYTNKTRNFIYELLLESIKLLARKVKGRIIELMEDVKLLNQERLNNDQTALGSSSNKGYNVEKGALLDRFTQDTVVITSNQTSKLKRGCDINLASMGPLTCKSSCQITFLRVLKVLIQIRENAIKLLFQQKLKLQNDENAKNDMLFELTKIPPPISDTLKLNLLWSTLSECLLHLEQTSDHHAVLVLQPAVEAFFLVHASAQKKTQQNPQTTSTSTHTRRNNKLDDDTIASTSSSSSSSSSTSSSISAMDSYLEQKKFLQFAEKHRIVLNQILRQSTSHLGDGPFACLVDHARILDFDVKRRYFRTELERLDEGVRREELAVHVHRVTVFEDSFRELYRRSPEEWKNRFYIVFEDEEGQDAGGLLREWYVIISREIFNPMYALFTVSPGDRVTYMINSSSHANPNHLCYYKFVGRVIAKAIYDNKLLECYFTRSFYKHILGIQVKYTDMESEDYDFYKGLVFLMENKVSTLGYDLTFSLEVQEFGVTSVRDLITNGRNITVTEENKLEYIQMVCQLKMSGSIKQQLNAFLEGFYDIIPKRLISIFNEQELELLISGLPNIDIEDLRINTEYHKYEPNSIQIQWFWRAVRSFNQAERAKLLQFVTGTSKVPLQGFAALEGMNGIQKFQIHRDDRSTDRLPSAHTCFNQLDLPVYKTYDKLRYSLLKAVHECTEGFGFA